MENKEEILTSTMIRINKINNATNGAQVLVMMSILEALLDIRDILNENLCQARGQS